MLCDMIFKRVHLEREKQHKIEIAMLSLDKWLMRIVDLCGICIAKPIFRYSIDNVNVCIKMRTISSIELYVFIHYVASCSIPI